MTVEEKSNLILKNYFSAHLTILRFFGLWSYGNLKSLKEILYLIYRIAFLFTFAYLFTILEIIQLYFSRNNFDDFIANLCYSIVHVMACSKITLILVRVKDIRKIIAAFESGIFQIREKSNPKEIELVKECILRTKKLLKIYFIIGTSVVTNGLLCPLYMNSDNLSKEETVDIRGKNFSVEIIKEYVGSYRKLPYMSYFPINVNETPYHELAYVYQGICLMTLSPIIITTDVLYGSILLHIATQLRILNVTLTSLRSIAVYNLRSYGPSIKDRQIISINLLDKEIYRTLKYCVLHHHAIISLTEKMEKTFSALVLMQFLANLIIMCFPLFQMISVPIISFPFWSMVSLMTAMMYQLFIFCNCGDEVTQQSLLVADAAYFSDWYNSSMSEVHRAIFLILDRAQRPLRLTAAKFTVLSRETYLRVVQGSASYFMFLRKMQGE